MAGFIVQPQTLFSIGPSRQFGGNTNAPTPNIPGVGNQGQPIFKGYVTINENSIDSIEITQQPVQQGANIADHAFKKPTTLSIQILMDGAPGFSLSGGLSAPQSLSTIYKNLLALQNSFIPFNCTTPKRTYYNMLFATLGVTTEKGTENILSVNATFQQIITVPVGVTTVSRSQLKNAGSNGSTQGAGAKTLQSTLYTGWNAITGLAGGATP
jgi:hypothetical protein